MSPDPDLLYRLLKALVLPPASLALLVLLALAWRRRPLLGRGLAAFSAMGILALSLPIVAARLMAGVEPYPALTAADLSEPAAQAILVLGAGRYTGAPEYGGDDVGALTLQRLRYAARLQRLTGLPLYVTGGSPPGESPPLGRLMARVLREDFQVPVSGVEDLSQNTRENALYSAELLTRRGITHVFLVSHAWHLGRAVPAFQSAGLQVTPAPTAFVHRDTPGVERGDFLPGGRALLYSYYAVHEYLGQAWYALREALL
jgi:uncharacterized SAM-binding protein YcdF (DUF218 family)